MIVKAMYSQDDDNNNTINVEETAEKLFNDLDKTKQGYVETVDLIEKLLSNGTHEVDDVTDIYNKISNVLLTKSEDIIAKLKQLQQRHWIVRSTEFKDSIEFIVKTITEEHLFELDAADFKQKVEGPLRMMELII